jgi:multidrug resistance efflux pump
LAAVIETTHLAPDSRKHTRVRPGSQPGQAAVGLVVEAGSHLLDVVDWSLEGVGVSRLPDELAAAGEGPVRVSVEVESTRVSFAGRVRVLRPPGGGGEAARASGAPAALTFVDLSASGAEVLRAVADAARLGVAPKLATVLERVDPTEVTLVGTGGAIPLTRVAPLPLPTQTPPAEKGWRPPLRVLLYVGVGVLLTAYLASTLYARVWRIEVDAASIVAPTARIVSPADGVLLELHGAPGDRVPLGASLFVVESPSVQADLDRVELEVGKAAARVAQRAAERETAAGRLAIHGRMLRARVAAKAAQVSLLGARLGFADTRVARLSELVGDAVSSFEVDDARAGRARIAGEASELRSQLAVEQGRLGAARKGYYFDGDGVEDGVPEADAALAAAEAELALWRRQQERQVARADLVQNGRAPFSGRVAAVEQAAGMPVREGDLVVVLEQEDALRVEAWITRHEAEYVRIGAPARVSVAGLGRVYDATVQSVDANPGASAVLAEKGEGPRLEVVLDLGGYAGEPETRDAARAALREVDAIGLPVVVSFERSWR